MAQGTIALAAGLLVPNSGPAPVRETLSNFILLVLAAWPAACY